MYSEASDVSCYVAQFVELVRIEARRFPFRISAGTRVPAVAQWLRYCATSREVAGSIPAGVSGIFH